MTREADAAPRELFQEIHHHGVQCNAGAAIEAAPVRKVKTVKRTSLVVAAALAAAAWLVGVPARSQDEPSPLLGKPMPNVRVKDLAGKDTSLAAYKGKVVVISLSAHW